MPRITAVDECDNFSKALKTSQMLLFWTPTLTSRYDVWGDTHAINPLKGVSGICGEKKEK